jgi:SAM-dependent methyltransferase
MTNDRVSDSWNRGSPYENYVGRWSRRVAPAFLSWLELPCGQRWLDVGCGTGALAAAVLDRCAPASVVGVEPSEGFLATARANLQERATLHGGDATHLPLPDACVDVVVSGLVLNFLPDQLAALNEMARVTASGGTVAAYVWDYAGKMELMRYFWDTAVELNPAARTMDEGVRFPSCDPDALAELFASGPFEKVEVRGIEIATPFTDFDEYWQPFLGGQGPAPAYAMSLTEAERATLRDELRARIPSNEDGSLSLFARAWAVRANVARR